MTDLDANLIPTKPHRRLQWRLVRSYMIVSAVTATLIGGGIAAWMAYYFFGPSKMTHDLELEMPRAVQKLEAFFGPEEGQIDRAGLQHWLDAAMQTLASNAYAQIGDSPRLRVVFLDLNFGTGQVVILGKAGETLALSPVAQLGNDLSLDRAPKGMIRRDVPVAEQLTPEETNIVAAAWQGHCTSRMIEARLVGASPIPVSGQTRAVCYFRSDPVFTLRDEVAALTTSVAPVLVAVVVLSTLISGLLGYLTAKRLTRQFSVVAGVAAAWARGDFAATAPETSDDELGLLSRHLNRVAADLKSLIGLRHILSAVEERNRIARDLHDTVKQHIFAAGLQVGSAQTRLEAGDVNGVKTSLDELERLMERMRREMVTILEELRPVSPGEAKQFIEVLRGTVASWSLPTGIEADFQAEPIADPLPNVAFQLHHVLQEALANVARHSGARSVQVSLWQENATLCLEVEDDGKGFDAARPATGMVLQTMRERAEMLPGGAFHIVSTPGGGTRIVVRCAARAKSLL